MDAAVVLKRPQIARESVHWMTQEAEKLAFRRAHYSLCCHAEEEARRAERDGKRERHISSEQAPLLFV